MTGLVLPARMAGTLVAVNPTASSKAITAAKTAKPSCHLLSPVNICQHKQCAELDAALFLSPGLRFITDKLHHAQLLTEEEDRRDAENLTAAFVS